MTSPALDPITRDDLADLERDASEMILALPSAQCISDPREIRHRNDLLKIRRRLTDIRRSQP